MDVVNANNIKTVKGLTFWTVADMAQVPPGPQFPALLRQCVEEAKEQIAEQARAARESADQAQAERMTIARGGAEGQQMTREAVGEFRPHDPA